MTATITFYLTWDEVSKTKQGVQAYIDEWVLGVKDRHEYWEKLGRRSTQAIGCEEPPERAGRLWGILSWVR